MINYNLLRREKILKHFSEKNSFALKSVYNRGRQRILYNAAFCTAKDISLLYYGDLYVCCNILYIKI